MAGAALAAALLLRAPLAPAEEPPQKPPPAQPKPARPGGAKPKDRSAEPEAPREPTREERIEKAKEIFSAAEERFRAADYAAAIEGYRQANDTMRSPQAFLRIAMCLEKVGTRTEAIAAYHKFLGLPPPEAMAEEIRLASARIDDLSRATLRVSSAPASIQVEVDGQAAVSTPVEVRLTPGHHLVRASSPGFEPATREIDLQMGDTIELAIALVGLPPPPPPPVAVAPKDEDKDHPPSTINPRMAAYIAYGLSAVGLGVGIGYGVRAFSAKSDYDKTPTHELESRQQDSALGSDTGFGVAVIFGIVGTVFLLQGEPHDDHDHHHPAASAPPLAGLKLAPLLSPHVQGASALLRF